MIKFALVCRAGRFIGGHLVKGTVRLLRSDFAGPVNIGSQEMVTINQLVDLVADIASKRIGKRHIPGPQGLEAAPNSMPLYGHICHTI